MEWLKNLSKAIEYLENNLDKEVSYEKAAEIACCSTFYFQRMFSYVAGISLSEYIRRRRMTQAAFELQSTEQRVLDIALKYGYTSPTAFNRAFQNIHGISPAAARNRGNQLNAYLPIRLSVQITGGEVMPYRIEEKESIRIAGVRMPLSTDMEDNHKIVPPFWKKLMGNSQLPAIRRLSNQLPQGLLGVTASKDCGEVYYYVAAATDLEVPSNMYEYQIPASTWVIFENHGPYQEKVQNVFKRFLTEWLPFSGYTYMELPDIEVYPSDSCTQSGYSEVWIAVKKDG